MDVHVPGAVTAGLLRRNIDVLTSQQDDTATTPDPELLDRASALGRVLVSQDLDFLTEAAFRQRNGVEFAGIIHAPQQGLPYRKFIDDLEIIVQLLDESDLQNQVIYLPLP